jgi:beta-lactamase superfamily II metal-dependent hydrolase
MKWCNENNITVKQFWDSGFRHVSVTHYKLIKLLRESDISIVYPTSGYESTINKVAVRVLSPSIRLKNRYDTFGTNINNASIVLKLEYPPKDIAGYFRPENDMSNKELAEEEKLKQNTVILGADAQFDAWAVITDEFPTLRRTENRGQLIDKTRKHQPLKCQILKVPHHMSKHGISLEVLETLLPKYTIASCADKSEHGFPHELTVLAAQDIYRGRQKKAIFFTGHREKEHRSGTVVSVLRGEGEPLIYELGESKGKDAPL